MYMFDPEENQNPDFIQILLDRYRENRKYLDEYGTNLYSSEASEWLKGYDQRIREEIEWIKPFIKGYR
jgi:hypothetical protein